MTAHTASSSTSSGIWSGAATDLRQAFRLLWKSKRITATTLLTLALCIGATTAIFSTVYSLMLKPLPYQEPERIVELYTSASKAGLHHMPANVPFYLDYSDTVAALRERVRSIDPSLPLFEAGALIGAALLSRSMATLLFNVKPTDPAVYAAVSFVLIGVALLASYLPARRASRIDPLIALREE